MIGPGGDEVAKYNPPDGGYLTLWHKANGKYALWFTPWPTDEGIEVALCATKELALATWTAVVSSREDKDRYT